MIVNFEAVFFVFLFLHCQYSNLHAKTNHPKVDQDEEFAPVNIDFLSITNQTDIYEVADDDYYSLIKGLSIEDSNLTFVPTLLLKKFVSLKELTLRRNKIANFTIEKLDPDGKTISRNVERLQIEKQELGVLNDETFKNYDHLMVLRLICTSVHTMQSKAFEGLENLITLDLSGNYLTTLKEGTLSPLIMLEELILISNQFSKLGDIFGDTVLNKLEILHMENNPIKGINMVELKRICPAMRRYEYCIGHVKPCKMENNFCSHV